jgi:addiction module HigA family antidote
VIPTNRVPTHPGEVLREEFLEPLSLSVEAFANYIGVATDVVEALTNETSPVTAQLAWLLGMATGTGPELWMNLQSNYDLAQNRPHRELSRLTG